MLVCFFVGFVSGSLVDAVLLAFGYTPCIQLLHSFLGALREIFHIFKKKNKKNYLPRTSHIDKLVSLFMDQIYLSTLWIGCTCILLTSAGCMQWQEMQQTSFQTQYLSSPSAWVLAVQPLPMLFPSRFYLFADHSIFDDCTKISL